MSKSLLTVTMPMTEYERLSAYEKKYRELCDTVRGIVDTRNFDCGSDTFLRLDTARAIELVRPMLAYKHKDADIIIDT